MNTVYAVKDRLTGKKVAESTTREHALREARWRGEIVPGSLFDIDEISRGAWGGYDFARSDRMGSSWPDAKLQEFKEHYLAMVPGKMLMEYFDCSNLSKPRKKLGLAIRPLPRLPARTHNKVRIQRPKYSTIKGRLFFAKIRAWDRAERYQEHLKSQVEKHGLIFPTQEIMYPRAAPRSLTDDEKIELMHFMLSEGADFDEIAKHFGLKARTVVLKLKKTESQYGASRRLRIARRQYRRTGKDEVYPEVAVAGWPYFYLSRGRQPRNALSSPVAGKTARKPIRRTTRRRFISMLGAVLRDHGVRPPKDGE